MIYSDYAATTPLSSRAYEAMRPYLEDHFGNPSTLHRFGRTPRLAIAAAREEIAAMIGAKPEEIYFTSGGTESDNWAIKGIALAHFGLKNRIAISAIEHHAVQNPCSALAALGFETEMIQVDQTGMVTVEEFDQKISSHVLLASVMTANNEIGTIEPIAQLTEIAHEHGVLFHTDAVQAVGHIRLDVRKLGVDLLSASAHKFYGPKGIGFLFIREGTKLFPLIHGGGQESGQRSGTENVAGIIGMAEALKECIANMEEEAQRIETLRNQLLFLLKTAGLDFLVNGNETHHLPGSLSLSFRGVQGETLLHRLDLMGIAIATGSACNSRETVLSHVIRAIDVPKDYAGGTVRITFGRDSRQEHVTAVAEAICKILLHL